MPSPFRLSSLLIGFVVASLALAQSTQGELAVAESERWGAYLTDAAGITLYVYLSDQGAATSTCVDQCVNNWPPVPATDGSAAGNAVDPELIGSIDRPDGTSQLTYGGWPLYRFARDSNAGDMRGQGLGDAFFVLAVDGSPVTDETEAEQGPVDEALLAALQDEGSQLFSRNCAVCHGAEGQGVIGPALAGMTNLESAPFITSTIITGRTFHGMPAFGDQLDDREIAAIATFVRTSWGNDFGLVEPEEVVEQR